MAVEKKSLISNLAAAKKAVVASRSVNISPSASKNVATKGVRYAKAGGNFTKAGGNFTKAGGNFTKAGGNFTKAGGNFTKGGGNFTKAGTYTKVVP